MVVEGGNNILHHVKKEKKLSGRGNVRGNMYGGICPGENARISPYSDVMSAGLGIFGCHELSNRLARHLAVEGLHHYLSLVIALSLSRVSILTRDINITNLFVRLSVRP